MKFASRKAEIPSFKWINNRGTHLSKQEEMDFTYTNVDKLIRLSLGETPHVDNALYYGGDFSISLENSSLRTYACSTEVVELKLTFI